jgi:hypothetical protein
MEVQYDLAAGSFKGFSKNGVFPPWPNTLATCFMMVVFSCLGLLPVQAQEKTPSATTRVRMTVTVRLLDQSKPMPDVNREDVIVKQGNAGELRAGLRPAEKTQAWISSF